jgi:kynureninase
MHLMDETAPHGRTGYSIGTPREPERRGGHVAVEHEEAVRINEALKARGVVPDFRYPNVIRLAPVPLYTGFVEVWETVRHLREIAESEEYTRFPGNRGDVA